MLGLRELTDIVDKELRIAEHDVTPCYISNIKEVVAGMVAMLDIIERDLDIIVNIGEMKKMKQSKKVFKELFNYTKIDVLKNRRWSFWHFMALCLITSVAHEKLIQQNKHSTIDLQKQSTWDNPTWEVAVLFVVFAASALYKDELVKFIEINSRGDVNTEILSRFLVRKMKLLNGEIQ